MNDFPNIKNRVLVGKDTFDGRQVLLVQEKMDLATDQVINYDLEALLEDSASEFDLTRSAVKVSVLDIEVGSATNGYYIGAETVAQVGYKDTGEIRIQNKFNSTLNFYIQITVYRKPSQPI